MLEIRESVVSEETEAQPLGPPAEFDLGSESVGTLVLDPDFGNEAWDLDRRLNGPLADGRRRDADEEEEEEDDAAEDDFEDDSGEDEDGDEDLDEEEFDDEDDEDFDDDDWDEEEEEEK